MEGHGGSKHNTIAALWSRPSPGAAKLATPLASLAKESAGQSNGSQPTTSQLKNDCIIEIDLPSSDNVAIAIAPEATPLPDRCEGAKRAPSPSENGRASKKPRSNNGSENAKPYGDERCPAVSISAFDPPAPGAVPLKDLLQAVPGQDLVAQLTQRKESLAQTGLPAPLIDIEGLGPGTAGPFTDAKLAELVAWQPSPLRELVNQLLPLFTPPPNEEQSLTAEVLLSRICLLATRKSFASKKAQDSLLNVLEDTLPSMLWRWELREVRVLASDQRQVVVLGKKRSKAVQDALSALDIFADVLQTCDLTGDKVNARAQKAWDAYCKAITAYRHLIARASHQSASGPPKKTSLPMSAKQTNTPQTDHETARLAKEAEKERWKREREEEKERLLKEKEAEKERVRQEKEAEKERIRQEKEAEKERLRQEKEAEKEKAREEHEAAKISRKTGFKHEGELDKARSKFLSFFSGKSPASGSVTKGSRQMHVDLTGQTGLLDAKTATPVFAGGRTPGTAATGCSDRVHHTMTPGPARRLSMAGTSTPGSGVRRDRTYDELFLKPEPSAALEGLPSIRDRTAEMDKALLRSSAINVVELWRGWVLECKSKKKTERRPSGVLGLPPSWARKRKRAWEIARQRHDQSVAAGVEPAQVKTWRRKLIWFPADSARPAFYGSVGERCSQIGPRRFLGRDPALDYEVMSDLEWEEEPEGTSLSDCDGSDAGSEGDPADSDMEGSFMVADGYLSEDEGIRSDEDIQMLAEEDEAVVPGEILSAGGADLKDDEQLVSSNGANGHDLAKPMRLGAQLGVLVERAKRVGQPLIISRLPEPSRDFITHLPSNNDKNNGETATRVQVGDAELLQSLPVILGPDPSIRVVRPAPGEDLNADLADGGPASTSGSDRQQKDPADAKKGGGQYARPEELLPELVLLARNEPHMTKKQMIEQFMGAHADLRIPKSWVASRLSTFVEWKGRTATLTPLAQEHFKETLASATAANPKPVVSDPPKPEPLLAAFQKKQQTVPDWMHALSILESAKDDAVCELGRVLDSQLLQRTDSIGIVPGFFVSGLIERLEARDGSASATRTALCKMLLQVCEWIVSSSSKVQQDSTASQMAWAAARAGPAHATLESTAAELQFLWVLPLEDQDPPELRDLAMRTVRALCTSTEAAALLRPQLIKRGIEGV